MAKGWLDNYGKQENYNSSKTSAPEGFEGDGFSNVGRNYSPAWGGQFQLGGNVYPVNYVPQAQNGKKNNKNKNIQDKVEDWLGHPMQKAEQAADEYTDLGEEQTDNIRHPMAGRFTSEAIQNKFPSWMRSIGLPQVVGFLGGSAAGLGHELIEPNRGTTKRPYSMWDTVKEGAEDQLNNMVGAAIGSTPFISKKQKSETIKYLSDNNILPDGYRDKDNMYKKHAMGGTIAGAPGFSYARTQGAAPSNGPYAKKTLPSAQNGKEMQYYQNGLDFQPKTISKNGSWLSKYEGEVIKDDRGQWDHPGEITEIGSNNITMEGVPYDVLGISDTGDTKLMKPGKNYKFKGKKVTEYPMAKNGLRQEQKGLQNLDNLTNFTNYNKPTIGGWLNKYN